MRQALLLLTCLSGCVSFNAASTKLPAETDEPPMGFPREWDVLSPKEAKFKLDKMLAAGRLFEIKELAKSPIEDSRHVALVELAARCVVERVRPDQLLPLCREFEASGPAWQVAFGELQRRNPDEATSYLREVPAVR